MMLQLIWYLYLDDCSGTCRSSFHPICAREAKHRMEIWGKIDSDNVRDFFFFHLREDFLFSVAPLFVIMVHII